MDVLVTALGEFVWTVSCTIINFCVSSGFSALAVFVSFLCAILASAFYRYTISREHMSFSGGGCPFANQARSDLVKPATIMPITEPSIEPILSQTTIDESDNINTIESLSEIEVDVEEITNEAETRGEETSTDILIDTVEGSEEEIQQQQIANIYRLLNDQHLINNWSTTDFLEQLKMYGLQAYEEDESQFCEEGELQLS